MKIKFIRELKLENDEITSNRTLINKEIESFYANMYTSKIDELMKPEYRKKIHPLKTLLKALISPN